MNQTQRKFLIDKLTAATKIRVGALEEAKLKLPNLDNYTFKAILEGTLVLRTQEEIMEALRNKALRARSGEKWLSTDGWRHETDVSLKAQDLFHEPPGYAEEAERIRIHNAALNKEIGELRRIQENLEVRIQLAPDKTLQRMINEVDDMGDLSLMYNKLRLLAN